VFEKIIASLYVCLAEVVTRSGARRRWPRTRIRRQARSGREDMADALMDLRNPSHAAAPSNSV
jgi:hypothetical protein